jgi:threonine dehydratase
MDGVRSETRRIVTIADFRHIRARIHAHIRTTPVIPCGLPNVFLKLETLQHTHSFKVRGAFAHISQLVETSDKRTILTVSAGNHGLGLAKAASTFDRSCMVIVPRSAPKTKIDAIRAYGADLRVEGSSYDEAEELALGLAGDVKKYAFVSPYNDPFVVLGQGTLGFELLEQFPDVGAVVIPVGGGGLAAGVAAVVKELRPAIRTVGVQAEASAAIYHSLKAGKMVKVPDVPSIADGIAGNIDLDTITFPLIQKYLDDVVLVSEAEIMGAMNRLLHHEKLLVEGSAAAAYAALEHGKVKADVPTVAIMTGGNVDVMLNFSSLPL